MSILTPMFERDENLGLGTPDFFSSAWNADQNEYLFGESFRSVDEYSPYAPQLRQGQAENNKMEFSADQLDSLFSNRTTSQSGYSFGNTQSNDDLDDILGASDTPTQARSAGNFQPDATLIHNSQLRRVQNSDGVEAIDLTRKASAHPIPAKLVTKFEDGMERNTLMRFGQITPVDSPPEDISAMTKSRMSSSKHRRDQLIQVEPAPKVKKPRKSKKKPLSHEQEELRRTKFLERNRVAADKCRQNRKRWIDDLQSKVHHLGAENSAKKAQVEELEQEIVQLKSLLFIHSRQCDEPDVSRWVDEESSRVQTRGRLPSGLSVDDELSTFGQGMDDELLSMGQPSPSHEFGIVDDATSRRFSTATTSDDFFSLASGDTSKESSRRPSMF